MATRYDVPLPLVTRLGGTATVAEPAQAARHAVVLTRDAGLRQRLACQLQSCFVPHFADTSEAAVALAACVPHGDLLIVDSEFAGSVGPLVSTWPEAICVLMCAAPGSSSGLRALGSVVHLIIERPPTQATIVAINCAVMSFTDG